MLRPGGALACWGYGMPAICAPPGAGADPAALAHLRCVGACAPGRGVWRVVEAIAQRQHPAACLPCLHANI